MSAAQSLSGDKGWSAHLRLGFSHSPRKTVLSSRERYGPLAVQRPFYPEGKVCHVYLLHPPGGVVGGDLLQIESKVGADSHALVTTPGATKFYRSAGELAQQTQRLNIADSGVLEWFPQENIYFPGAEARLQTRIELTGNAHLAMWEINCLGRPSIQETFDAGHVDAGLQLWRDGAPVLLERLHMDAQRNTSASILRGQPVTATLLMNHADNKALTKAREWVFKEDQPISAATLIEDLLIVRYLGGSTEQARKLFVAIWRTLRPALMGKMACIPRIWAS